MYYHIQYVCVAIIYWDPSGDIHMLPASRSGSRLGCWKKDKRIWLGLEDHLAISQVVGGTPQLSPMFLGGIFHSKTSSYWCTSHLWKPPYWRILKLKLLSLIANVS